MQIYYKLKKIKHFYSKLIINQCELYYLIQSEIDHPITIDIMMVIIL